MGGVWFYPRMTGYWCFWALMRGGHICLRSAQFYGHGFGSALDGDVEGGMCRALGAFMIDLLVFSHLAWLRVVHCGVVLFWAYTAGQLMADQVELDIGF